MSTGIGIFLIVLGAIIAFALPGLNVVDGANWELIGIILMGAGAVITIISVVLLAKSRKAASITTVRSDGAGGQIRATESKSNLPLGHEL